MWIATKRQQIGRNGRTVWVEAGEPVPEAESWAPHWRADTRFVKWVDDPPPAPSPVSTAEEYFAPTPSPEPKVAVSIEEVPQKKPPRKKPPTKRKR